MRLDPHQGTRENHASSLSDTVHDPLQQEHGKMNIREEHPVPILKRQTLERFPASQTRVKDKTVQTDIRFRQERVDRVNRTPVRDIRAHAIYVHAESVPQLPAYLLGHLLIGSIRYNQIIPRLRQAGSDRPTNSFGPAGYQDPFIHTQTTILRSYLSRSPVSLSAASSSSPRTSRESFSSDSRRKRPSHTGNKIPEPLNLSDNLISVLFRVNHHQRSFHALGPHFPTEGFPEDRFEDHHLQTVLEKFDTKRSSLPNPES